MIPEKWEAIYLYASVDEKKTGELYFYYLPPKGLLKKKPVNVYEIPQKFNINEEEYLSVVQKLYNCIKDLKQDFIDTEQDLWYSITISIVDGKFKIEYVYDEPPYNERESNERRIIWRYKYLKIGGEKKEERQVLDDYFSNTTRKRYKKEVYETGLYIKTGRNEVSFDKEETISSSPKFEREKKPYEKINPEYQKVKKEMQQSEDEKVKYTDSDKKNKGGKNQILNM